MAASVVGKAIGADKSPEPSSDSISNAIASAMASPEQRAALLKAEQEFQLQMAELGYKNAADLEEIAEKDRDSARNREIQVRDHTPEIGFYLLATIYCVALFCLFRYPVPQDNKALIYSGLGTLGAIVVGAANYFYGTSRGSERKTELLAAAPAVNPK